MSKRAIGPRLKNSRAARVLARTRELVPLSNLGLTVLVLASLAYFGFGVPRVDYVVQLASVLALALVAAALFSVLLGSFLVARSLNRSAAQPIRFEAHRGFGEGLVIPSHRWLPMLETSWTWERPQGVKTVLLREHGEVREQIETERRGLSDHILRRFVVEDAFGLARIILRREELRPVEVLPWSGELERSPLMQSLALGAEQAHPLGRPEGDRVDMRRYVAGDPLRLILWKIYARTRELMVRTPEHALAPAVRVVAYLPSCVGDEPAAAAARIAIEGGLLGEDWLFSTDGAERPTADPIEARRLILASRSHRDRGDATDLEAFLNATMKRDVGRAVLFLPGVPGPWLERVVRAAKAHAGSVTAVVVRPGTGHPGGAKSPSPKT